MTLNLEVLCTAPLQVDLAEIQLESPLSLELDANVGTPIDSSDIPIYAGPYVAIPAVYPQKLMTSGKRMTDDVDISAIPYYDVSNEKGRTIIIGGTT